ncbi:MAG: SRPBCC family protein [Arenimonas sp.]
MAWYLGDTMAMKISCHASQDFVSDASTIFDLVIDADNFPGCFTGYGLIPAIRRVRLAEPLAVGVVRHIYNADNSVLTERVTILDKPHRHAYLLSGFKAPFSWLVKQGESDWHLEKTGTGTRVNWAYEFTLTSFLLYIPSFILLKLFMQRAMQACLNNMDAFCNKNQKVD